MCACVGSAVGTCMWIVWGPPHPACSQAPTPSPHTLPPNLPPPTHLTPPTLPSQPMASQWLAGSVKVEVCSVCVACTASHEVLSLEHLWCQEVRLQMCSVHPFSLCTRQKLFVHGSLRDDIHDPTHIPLIATHIHPLPSPPLFVFTVCVHV